MEETFLNSMKIAETSFEELDFPSETVKHAYSLQYCTPEEFDLKAMNTLKQASAAFKKEQSGHSLRAITFLVSGLNRVFDQNNDKHKKLIGELSSTLKIIFSLVEKQNLGSSLQLELSALLMTVLNAFPSLVKAVVKKIIAVYTELVGKYALEGTFDWEMCDDLVFIHTKCLHFNGEFDYQAHLLRMIGELKKLISASKPLSIRENVNKQEITFMLGQPTTFTQFKSSMRIVSSYIKIALEEVPRKTDIDIESVNTAVFQLFTHQISLPRDTVGMSTDAYKVLVNTANKHFYAIATLFYRNFQSSLSRLFSQIKTQFREVVEAKIIKEYAESTVDSNQFCFDFLTIWGCTLGESSGFLAEHLHFTFPDLFFTYIQLADRDNSKQIKAAVSKKGKKRVNLLDLALKESNIGVNARFSKNQLEQILLSYLKGALISSFD